MNNNIEIISKIFYQIIIKIDPNKKDIEITNIIEYLHNLLNNDIIDIDEYTKLLSIYHDISYNNPNLTLKAIFDLINDIGNKNNINLSDIKEAFENNDLDYFNEFKQSPENPNYDNANKISNRIKDKYLVNIEYAQVISNECEILDNNSVKCDIILNNGKSLSLFLWKKWTIFSNTLKKGVVINIFNAYSNTFPIENEIHIFKESLLVIEPDFLINASSLSYATHSKYGYCLYPYLLQMKKLKVADKLAPIKGTIIG